MKKMYAVMALALLVLVGCHPGTPTTGGTGTGTGAGGKKVMMNNTTSNHDAASVFKSLAKGNGTTITLAEFQAIPTENIIKKEKVADAAAREKTFNEYAGPDGNMNESQFSRCWNDLTRK